MVYMGKSFGDIVSGRKSTTDFMNQAQEEERIKRAQAMQEQMMPLQLEQAKLGLDKTQLDMEKLRHEMSQPQTPFTGKGLEADMVRAAYQQNISNGMDPVKAEQAAYDQLLGTKVTTQMITDPDTGMRTFVDKPRKPMFGVGGVQDPMAAHQEALNQRVGEIGANPFQNTVNLDQQGIDDQLAGIDVGQGGVVPGAPGVSMQPVANQESARTPSVYDAVQVGTGAVPVAKEAIGNVFGQFDQDLVDQNLVQSRNLMRDYERELSTIKTISNRPSVWEQKMVQKISPSVGVFENPASASSKLAQQHQQAIQDYNAFAAASKDFSKHKDVRKEAAIKAQQVYGFINKFFGGDFEGASIPQIDQRGGLDLEKYTQPLKNIIQNQSNKSNQSGGFEYLGTE